MKQGTQIIYVPSHIPKPNIYHIDTEFGFVFGKCADKQHVFCRYWSKYNPNELRTKANSEATPIDRLVIKDTRKQSLVDQAIKEIENEILC